MKCLRPLWIELQLAYLKWAQREMCPSHPDAAFVALEINRLEWERRVSANSNPS